MKKNSITKFIDKSKSIINAELNAEKKSSFENEITAMLKDDLETDNNTVETKSIEKEVTDNVEVNKSMAAKIEPPTTTSFIASDVMINGDLIVKGNLELNGMIDGNIECHSNLKVNGVVKGNIKTSSVTIGGEKVTGNIECENDCVIATNVELLGDILADEVTLKGKMVGTINAKNKVVLHSSAELNGDCITSKLIIEEGAIIKGNIQTKE